MAVDSLVPNINGVAYTHANVVLNFLGAPIIGVISIEYGDTQAITNNYSTGNNPTSVGFGQVEPTATLTLSFEAMRLVSLAAPLGVIQNIPFFDLGINYIPEGQPIVRHILKRCRFKGRQQSTETGNSEIPVTLELNLSQIQYFG